MRFLGFIPLFLGLGALALEFLCLFAGSQKGFMEDFSMLTLNTSRIGENVLSSGLNISDPVGSALAGLLGGVEGSVEEEINSLAKVLGLHDYYSTYMLDYCEGYYTPGPVPNATLSSSDIKHKTTSCSGRKAMFYFDPKSVLQNELDNSGHGDIDLDDLNWNNSLTDGLEGYKIAQYAAFVLYCIAIGIICVMIMFSLVSIAFNGRLTAFINIMLSSLAFLCSGIASAITTAVAVNAENIINRDGKNIGISAKQGEKFMGISWGATACVLVCILVWTVDCCIGPHHRRARSHGKEEY